MAPACVRTANNLRSRRRRRATPATAIRTFGKNAIGVDASGDTSGVAGTSSTATGRGVFGHSTCSTNGTGVYGYADAPSGVGVRGVGFNGGQGKTYGTGVVGVSGPGADPD